MNIAVKPLEELIRELSPTLRAEVRDFVEFLLTKRSNPGSANSVKIGRGHSKPTNRNTLIPMDESLTPL